MEYFIGFIVLLLVLIFVHEFGHFIVAKIAGVKVLKFSLGFPPAAIKRKWGETEYMLSWIPLGGYVKLLGETPDSDEEIPPEDAHRTLESKPLLSRFAIIAAGPLTNFALAAVLLSSGFLAGRPVLVSEVGKVLEGSPAMEAGMKAGDLVTAIEGQKIWRWDDMRRLIEKRPGQALNITVKRNGQDVILKVTPRVGDNKDLFGRPVGRVGIAPSGKGVKLGFLASIREGCRFTVHLTRLVFETLAMLVKGDISPKALGGPIQIVQAAGESFRAGPIYFMFLMSYISINLAIINLLPIPILDGGHLLFYLIEAITRKPVTGRVREVATQVGLLFIVFLMLMVFYNDISRIITQGWSLKP